MPKITLSPKSRFPTPSRFIRSNSDPERLVNKPNADGWTPLYVACLNGNFEVFAESH